MGMIRIIKPYYNVLYAKRNSTDEENIHSIEKKYITKYIKMVEVEKIREKKKRLYLCYHPSRIKTSFITAKKDMQKYLNLVEVENIREDEKNYIFVVSNK